MRYDYARAFRVRANPPARTIAPARAKRAAVAGAVAPAPVFGNVGTVGVVTTEPKAKLHANPVVVLKPAVDEQPG
jgi:hypothetical protein